MVLGIHTTNFADATFQVYTSGNTAKWFWLNFVSSDILNGDNIFLKKK